jgi:hypothetical protein
MTLFPLRLARRLIKTIKKSSICCNLETPATGALCPGTFNSFSGWVFSTHGPHITGVEFVQNGHVIGTCEYGFKREDVYKAFPRYPQARQSGFSGWAVISGHSPYRIDVYSIDESGRRHLLGSRTLPWRARIACFFKKTIRKAHGVAARTQPPAEIPPSILIAGLAKTGTTALFFKISNSLAVSPEIAAKTTLLFEPTTYSGSQNNRVLSKIIIAPNSPFTLWGENRVSRWVDFQCFNDFSKKILLIRDPRDRLISGLLYSSQGLEFRSNPKAVESFISLLQKKEQNPRAVSVLELVQARINSQNLTLEEWKNTLCASLNFFLNFRLTHPDYFNLKYEDFVDGKTADLEAFLGFPLIGAAEVQKSYDRVVRTKAYGDWKKWFTEEDIAFFKPLFQPFMRKFGYEDSWDLPEHQVIVPQHGSDYIRRITKPYK